MVELNLATNQLSKIPEDICGLVSLEVTCSSIFYHLSVSKSHPIFVMWLGLFWLIIFPLVPSGPHIVQQSFEEVASWDRKLTETARA